MLQNRQIKIIITGDGSDSIYVPDLDEHYHSTFGAIQESEHIYIGAGLHSLANSLKNITILEVGLGTGLNALLTFREASKKDLKIDYTGIEAFPLPPEIYQKINYPEMLPNFQCKQVFLNLHQLPWNCVQDLSDDFSLLKIHAKLQDTDLQENKFDLVYFDAFSPDSQPEMWNIENFKKIYKAMKNGGVLVTYCVKGIVKQSLKKAGFTIEKLPGPEGKREILRATKV
jgi:tRNA U34 5-methylaminomethyl-2-thiouridine-forming methyltransferase MnmC